MSGLKGLYDETVHNKKYLFPIANFDMGAQLPEPIAGSIVILSGGCLKSSVIIVANDSEWDILYSAHVGLDVADYEKDCVMIRTWLSTAVPFILGLEKETGT